MQPDLPPGLTTLAGRFEVDFEVPGDLLTVGVELGDEQAAAGHAAFIDERLAGTAAPPEVREQALAQLGEVRAKLIDDRVRYLGLASGPLDDQWVFCLFGITVAGLARSDTFDSSHVLAAALRHHYGEDSCLVEEFETDHGPAVGLRRLDALTVPAGAHESGAQQRIDTGVAQAIVIFPELEVAGVVSGYCLDPDHIDLATVLVARIAHSLRISAAQAVAG